MDQKKLASALSVAALMLMSCGDEYITQQTGMKIIENAETFAEYECGEEIFGEMVLVTDEANVYVCSEGEWVVLNGKSGDSKSLVEIDGKDGESCTAQSIKDGFKIVCGEDSVGVVKNGKKGENGKDGESCSATEVEATAEHPNGGLKITCGEKSYDLWNGNDGKDGVAGTSCEMKAGAKDGEMDVYCGGKKQGTIKNGENGKPGAAGEGCTMDDNRDGTITITCGKGTASEKKTTINKATCGAKAYDPAEKFCFEMALYTLCDKSAYNPKTQECSGSIVKDKSFCDGEVFDPNEKFCFDKVLYDLCGGTDSYDPTKQMCKDGMVEDWLLCEGVGYNPEEKYCDGTKPVDKPTCGKALDKYDPTSQYCQNAETVADYGELTYGGRKYKTIKIGVDEKEHIWMAENLSYPTLTGSYCYEGEESNCEKYGRLYTWEAATSACPSGWRLPKNDDYVDLLYAIEEDPYSYGGHAGISLKSTSGWNEYESENGNGTDDYGFNALPGGVRTFTDKYFSLGEQAYFWLGNVYSDDDKRKTIFIKNGNIYYDPDFPDFPYNIDYEKHSFFRRMDDAISVRCIMK